jgi:hypothetical protein
MKRTSAGVAALIAAAVIGLLLFSREDRTPETEPPPEPSPSPSQEAPHAPPEPATASAAFEYADPAGENRLASGERVVFSEGDLAPGQPVVLHLLVPAPPGDVEALSVRLLSVDGRQLETEAVIVGNDRDAARLEFDAAFLSRSGRYLVEMKTKERTHLPLRRYVVEVR